MEAYQWNLCLKEILQVIVKVNVAIGFVREKKNVSKK
jgi:hypothetical protein